MSILNEFKKFALRGNVFDLAIGIIIGASFNRLVTSLVEDIVMPFVGLFLGRVDFSSLAFKVGHTVFKYGSFIQSIVDFLIVSFCVFIVVKAINTLQKDQITIGYESMEKKQLKALNEIRDALRQKQ